MFTTPTNQAKQQVAGQLDELRRYTERASTYFLQHELAQ
jgi:hypothetical protein